MKKKKVVIDEGIENYYDTLDDFPKSTPDLLM